MKKDKNKKDRMKIIGGNFLGLLLIGIIVICVGIGFLGSDGGSAWGTGWAPSVNKQKQEDQTTGLICIGAGIVIILAGGFYYSHAKANYLRDNEILSSLKSANSDESTKNKLSELKEMLDKNMITQEEYENKKKDLLDKM